MPQSLINDRMLLRKRTQGSESFNRDEDFSEENAYPRSLKKIVPESEVYHSNLLKNDLLASNNSEPNYSLQFNKLTLGDEF
jgi:hypothetical protein